MASILSCRKHEAAGFGLEGLPISNTLGLWVKDHFGSKGEKRTITRWEETKLLSIFPIRVKTVLARGVWFSADK